MRRFVLVLAAACGRHPAEDVTVAGTTLTYADHAPADGVLAAIARADPLEIRDQDGVVCHRIRQRGHAELSVRISATEWITKLTTADEENVIEPPFDQFAQIIDVYRHSPLFAGATDAELAAMPGTLAVTLTPALRTLCAAFPGIHAVRPDELAAKPTFGDTTTQPPPPQPTHLVIGTPTIDGPMTPAIARRFLVREAALFAACQRSATISFAIATDGHTTDVVAEPCLANALAAVHFPAPPAPVRVTVPVKYVAPP